MIEISRSHLHALRLGIEAALGPPIRGRTPAVTFEGTSEALLVRAAGGDVAVAVEYRIAGDRPRVSLSLPLSALKACDNPRVDAVGLESAGEGVRVTWSDAGVPQSAEHPAAEPVPTIPPTGTLHLAGTGFAAALGDAAGVAESGSTRFALGRVRLRGSDGQVAATDGRQALVQWGYSLPWEGDVLVPALTLFARPDFRDAPDALVGRSEGRVTVRAGAWTVSARVDGEGRFPDVDRLVPNAPPAGTTLEVSEADARFFLAAAGRLPGAGDPHAPVTLDLGGSVVVRARAAGQPRASELVLTGSRSHGGELRMRTDRRFLARALALGLRRFEFRGPGSPVAARDARRSFWWMLLDPAGTVPPDPAAARAFSPAENQTRASGRAVAARRLTDSTVKR